MNHFRVPFAVPNLPPAKAPVDPSLPRFDERHLKKGEEIGRGSFGVVYKALYRGEQVVVKEMRDDDMDGNAAKRFLKEAKIMKDLNSENIVRFRYVGYSPVSMMLEYACFDFGPLGAPGKRVSNLGSFLTFVNSFQMKNLEELTLKVARDVTNGLKYLHEAGIAHRDLKPANILVSNQHYSKIPDNEERVSKMKTCPIVCKLTDFGESRARLLQTQTMFETNTQRLQRGTLPFMAPEQLEGPYHIRSASQEDLMAMDIWQLGMTFFCLLNPDVTSPFRLEYDEQNQNGRNGDVKEFIARILNKGKELKYSRIYSRRILNKGKRIKIFANIFSCNFVRRQI